MRLLLEEIGGEFNDVLYLRGMTAKIAKWKQIEELRKAIDQASTGGELPPGEEEP